jgi:formylglycine-generating enzyme required for sulfatase activity
MGTDLNIAGISRAGSSGSYTYSVIGSANRPITYVSWLDSARFANWMANGQPTGIQTGTTTENGAYDVNAATSGNAVAKNATNPNTSAAPTFFIPTENEWYKAAFYSQALNSSSGGYYTYATQSNTAPGNVIGSGSNQANYYNGVFSVTQSASYSSSQNYLTDVGAFTSSASYYGTFDQSGNVYQWNDLGGTAGSSRGLRGGTWGDNAFNLSSAGRLTSGPSNEFNGVGFRLASPVAVPEPSTWVMAAGGLACVAWRTLRRRGAT